MQETSHSRNNAFNSTFATGGLIPDPLTMTKYFDRFKHGNRFNEASIENITQRGVMRNTVTNWQTLKDHRGDLSETSYVKPTRIYNKD